MYEEFEEYEGYEGCEKYTEYEEYAVEVNDENGFVRQLDVFNTYKEAEDFIKDCDETLLEGEYFNIIYIAYDEDGEEIDAGPA